MDRRSWLLGSLTLLALATVGRAQTPAPDAPAGTKSFKPEELDQILAPIALYPDSLLSQTLMAASYPLEVVEAARWSKANPALKGDAAVAAVKDQSWDVSVKSLVAFPATLVQMSDHLDWTQKLGDATISQQQDVADFDPAAARQSGRRRQPQERPAADRHFPRLRRRPHHRRRAGQPQCDLRAVLQSRLGLRRVALSGLSADLLSAAAGLRLRRGAGHAACCAASASRPRARCSRAGTGDAAIPTST